MMRNIYDISSVDHKNTDNDIVHTFVLATSPNEAEHIFYKIYKEDNPSIEVTNSEVVCIEDVELDPFLFVDCLNSATEMGGTHGDDLLMFVLQCSHDMDLRPILRYVMVCELPHSFEFLFEVISANNPNEFLKSEWLKHAAVWGKIEHLQKWIAYGCTDPHGTVLAVCANGGHKEMFDLVLPVSNPQASLQLVDCNRDWIEEQLALEQKQRIGAQMPGKPGSRGKKI